MKLTREGLLDAIFSSRRLEQLQQDVRAAMIEELTAITPLSPEVDGGHSPPSFFNGEQHNGQRTE